ncbi:YsnF/AvaK domain-containing protein [Ornithinimicrobium cerasi]|uniref:YsnF/AvaK domain-containing protein n=1 Tax=Ornithinimicrobium cerasi TaxID=2248773 RepID=UPI000EFDD5DD|nr:YsnF/AvaK domain-containing protein [Ornithinimicrobium cerasi]
MITEEQVRHLLDDGVVLDESSSKVGKVGQVFLDDQSGDPEWVTVSTGWFGTSETFVPLQAATVQGNEVRVPYATEFIKNAPRVNVDDHLSEDQEAELYRYYGIDGAGGDASGRQESVARAGDVDMNVGHDTSGPNTDEAMTRSEEHLDVHTERVEAGRARLRKYVVTENVSTTVPVQREEVRLEREPITEANRGQAMAGGELTEEEHEVVLSEERVVVDKETVPVERVALGKETVTEQVQVTEDVRKEQIEADLGEGRTDRA